MGGLYGSVCMCTPVVQILERIKSFASLRMWHRLITSGIRISLDGRVIGEYSARKIEGALSGNSRKLVMALRGSLCCKN